MQGEDVIKKLRIILAKSSADSIKLEDGKQVKVDIMTAKALLNVYDALGDVNRKKFASQIGQNQMWFKKLTDFAWKQHK